MASHAVGLSMIVIALAALLQAHRLGPVGSGYLATPVVSAIYFASALNAAHHGGLGLVCGMIAFAGVIEAIFAWALPRMRRVFPPVVSGFIVIAVGVELGLIGVRGFLGVADLHDPKLPPTLGRRLDACSNGRARRVGQGPFPAALQPNRSRAWDGDRGRGGNGDE